MNSSHRIRKQAVRVLLLALALPVIGQAPQMSRYNRELVQAILRDVYQAVKKNYYDTSFHGLDWEQRYKEHAARVEKATSLGEGFMIIEGMLEGLNDSHTFFLPPARPYQVESGFRMQMIGERAFIKRVRPGTDAESKLNPGDEVLSFNKYSVNRADLWKLEMTFNLLFPLTSVPLSVRGPDGKAREVVVNSRVVQGKRLVDLTRESDFWQLVRESQRDSLERDRYIETGNVMIWQMPSFVTSEEDVDRFWGIAKKHEALILDLRGNPGGLVTVLRRMVSNTVDHEVMIVGRKTRKEGKPTVAEGRGDKAYQGKIFVLVDSVSASASELFARVMQLEGRGKVVGDRSSGAVMESQYFPLTQGPDTKIFYGCSITDADLLMKDGKSLEDNGVVPDEIVLPSAEDLANGRDPALARAAQLAGLKMDAATAGKLFPFRWKPLN